jgi:hypothetical protein
MRFFSALHPSSACARFRLAVIQIPLFLDCLVRSPAFGLVAVDWTNGAKCAGDILLAIGHLTYAGALAIVLVFFSFPDRH